jgi:hypothetical protein
VTFETQRFQSGLVDITNCHLRPGCHKGADNFAAYALGASGDENFLTHTMLTPQGRGQLITDPIGR